MDLDRVPVRESGMTPYEIMLSESQERMLLVLKEGAEDNARAIMAKWDLDYATVGNKMTSAKAFQDAIAVIDAGIKKFPEDEKLPKLIEVVQAEAEAEGDEGALKALEGLGYL